jgi:recombination protein RecA
VAPPFKVIEFDIIYNEGISKVGEILDLGVDMGIIAKSGSWFSYNGDRLGQGREGVKTILQDNPELADQIEARIREMVKGEPQVALAAIPEDRTLDDDNTL